MVAKLQNNNSCRCEANIEFNLRYKVTGIESVRKWNKDIIDCYRNLQKNWSTFTCNFESFEEYEWDCSSALQLEYPQ